MFTYAVPLSHRVSLRVLAHDGGEKCLLAVGGSCYSGEGGRDGVPDALLVVMMTLRW